MPKKGHLIKFSANVLEWDVGVYSLNIVKLSNVLLQDIAEIESIIGTKSQ